MEELWNFFADVSKFCTMYFFANRNQENMSKKKTADKNGIVGDIGEHLVCYELSRLELRAVRTTAGAMGLDIIVYCPNTYRTATIQVKAGAGRLISGRIFSPRRAIQERRSESVIMRNSATVPCRTLWCSSNSPHPRLTKWRACMFGAPAIRAISISCRLIISKSSRPGRSLDPTQESKERNPSRMGRSIRASIRFPKSH